ncbi:MAG TPA: sensor histidine kinase [Candidatus Limnocylindria bacterium]|nr:sensor histidine kinase [Candidatus Limnocylindria bacterium]
MIEPGGPRPSGRPPDTQLVDGLILILAGGLAVLTAALALSPDAVPAARNERIDVALVTSAVLGSAAVAALAWARGRVDGDPAALFRASAFAVLAALNGMHLVVLLTGIEAMVGASVADPGGAPVLVSTLGRGVAAALLVAGGLPLARRIGGRTGWSLLVVPSAGVVAIAVLAVGAGDALPPIVEPSALDALRTDPTAGLPPGSSPLLMLVQAAIGVAFIAAAVVAYRSFRTSGRVGEGLMASGLVVAAFSQVHSAMHPGAFAGLVTTGDLLRLGFYAILLAGVVVDRRDDLRALREANVELRRLADIEVATAALEERARLAREIHDGLAQDLWYAKLKHSRLVQQAGLAGESHALGLEVERAIDAALAEARHAVSAMREGASGGTLADALANHVDDFGDRFALRAELVVDGTVPEVGPRVQAEVLRIVQEALTNARRHADATVVRVQVATDVDLRIAIVDNGRGFRPLDVTPGFGLESMRQRAALIGARLAVESEPHNGTRVELVIPRAGGGPEGEGNDG